MTDQDIYRGPTDLAFDIKNALIEKHDRCPSYIPGGCHLAELSSDDIQEILDLAAHLGEST